MKPHKTIPYIVAFTSFGMSIFLISQFLTKPSVGADSGFYLAVAKEFYNGATYFVDIGINYNPLSIILAGVPFLVSDSPSYVSHLAINILVIIGSTLLFYRLTKEYVDSTIERLAYASLFLLLCLVLDGRYVLLEPLSVFFQLLALCIYLPSKRIQSLASTAGVGLCIGLAFLSKQYGLFLVLPVTLDILLQKDIRFKKIVALGIGLLLPLIMLFIYLNTQGLSVLDYLRALIGKGVSLDIGTGTGAKTSFFSYPLDILYILLFNSYILTIPFMLWRFQKRPKDQSMLFWIVTILSSFTILIFANYWHYYQYIVPYTLLLFIFLWHAISKPKGWYLVSLLSSVLFLVAYSILGLPSAGKLEKQYEEAYKINETVPRGARVYLDGPSPAFYYLCEFRSINLRDISYNFPGCFYPSTTLASLDVGEFLIVDNIAKEAYTEVNSSLVAKPLILKKDTFFVLQIPR